VVVIERFRPLCVVLPPVAPFVLFAVSDKISDKTLRSEAQLAQTNGKAFCERPLALHRQQPEEYKPSLSA